MNMFILVLLMQIYQTKQMCPTEFSSMANNSQGNPISWKLLSNESGQVIFSNPECLDANGNSITRICDNGNWIPEITPVCHEIRTNKRCPPYFAEENEFCLLETELNCADLTNSDGLCLSGRRIIKFDSYKITNLQNHLNFLPCQNSSEALEPLSNESAMKCMNPNHFIYFVPYNYDFHICPKNCVSAGLATKRCFCKTSSASRRSLAVIDTTFQQHILEDFVGSDTCKVKRTSHSNVCRCKNLVINEHFYGYTNNITNCSIIDIRAFPKMSNVIPDLVLAFEREKRLLTLLIYNPEEIITLHRDNIRCYTDASRELITNVRITKQFESTEKEKGGNYLAYKLGLERYIGQYWCETFLSDGSTVRSNTLLAYQRKSGNEYALRLKASDVCRRYSCASLDFVQQMLLNRNDLQNIFGNLNIEIRLMQIEGLDKINGVVDFVVHITGKTEHEICEEYKQILEELQNISKDYQVLSLRSSEHCLPNQSRTDKGDILNWPLTKLWEIAIPVELCISDDGLPLTRTCEGGFITGAVWEENITFSCSKNAILNPVSKFLYNVTNSTITPELIDEIASFSANSSDPTVLDIYLYSKIFDNIQSMNNTNFSLAVFQIMNNLLMNKSESFSKAQELLNSTDKLLRTFDKLCSVIDLTTHTSFLLQTDNILLFITKPFVSNISGIYLQGPIDGNISDLSISYLKRGETFQNIPFDNFESIDSATYIPEEVLDDIQSWMTNYSDIHIMFTIFYRDFLFIDSTQSPSGKVISIKIPGYGNYLNKSVPVILRSTFTSASNAHCGFWDYGERALEKKGSWSELGGNYLGVFDNVNKLHLCTYSHLTHFALLLVSNVLIVDESDERSQDLADVHNSILSYITIAGGFISVIGILGIYATAIIFEQWRRKQGTKILLHLSTAILLEIVLLQGSDLSFIVNSHKKCLVFGIFLHYIVISKFCWIFVYAVLQYLRFVKVFGEVPKNLILKSTLFSWGCGAIPTIITVSLAPDSYNSQICYPTGNSLYYGTMLPIFIIVIFNLVVFILIMYHVSKKPIESRIVKDPVNLQIYLAVLLFFVLGLPWTFAVIAELATSKLLKIIMMYLFCLTATIQGFVLFIFYVVWNKDTRNKWLRYCSSTKTYTSE